MYGIVVSMIGDPALMTLLNWFERILLSVIAIVACWLAWYVVYTDSVSRSIKDEKSAPPAEMTVEIVPVRKDVIEQRIVLVGGLFPIAQTEIRSQVSGYITQLPFDVGDSVDVGSQLCQLDTTVQEEAIARATASLEVTRAQLRAQLTEEELAQANVDRQQNLVSNGAGTLQQFEAANASLKIANAGVDLEKARVQEAESTLERAKLTLQEMQLESPIAGFVAERMMDVGDLAKPDVPILRIVKLDTVQTTVNVVEKDYRKIQIGQRAEVRVDAYPDEIFFGEVARIAPILDPETRTAAVHLEVSNPEQLLKPGMYARVSLRSTKEREGLLVPMASLLSVNDESLVFVVNEESNTIEQRSVRLGTIDQDIAEVVDGLNEDEYVVTLGNRLVRPGQKVNALKVPWENSAVVASQTSSEPEPSTDASSAD